MERIREVLASYPRLGVPEVYEDFSTERLLVMEEIPGGPISDAPEGPERKEAAHQLIESYYKQILTEGFFHADPHPGNLMWSDGRVYFLDFGMVGEVGPELREGLVLLLLAFWQEDESFLAETLLLISGDEPHPELDLPRSRRTSGRWSPGTGTCRSRGAPARSDAPGHEHARDPLRGPAARDHDPHREGARPGPARDRRARPRDRPVRGRRPLPRRSTMQRVSGSIRPQQMLYEGQKVKVRITRLIEAFERLVGARPGPNLQVQFRGIEGLEANIRRASRRIAISLAALGAFIATAMLADSTRVASWVPPTFGALALLLTAGLVFDVSRRGR